MARFPEPFHPARPEFDLRPRQRYKSFYCLNNLAKKNAKKKSRIFTALWKFSILLEIYFLPETDFK